MRDVRQGLRASWVSLVANPVLAVVKIVSGVVGHSQALVADGIESCADVVGTLVVWNGVRIAARPPDRSHPYGHGKAESLAGLAVALGLFGAAAAIAVQSIREIAAPHRSPAPYTLAVLITVMAVKEALFRYVRRVGRKLDSGALIGDAWHHRSDAITSGAAGIGISIALIGGPAWAAADDWAALFACVIIAYTGARLLPSAVAEVMDAAVPPEIERRVRRVAGGVAGVREIEKCRIRKSGFGLLMDIHVVVDGNLSVREGHAIAHEVNNALTASALPVQDVVVHIEPDREEFGDQMSEG